jgi:hypothetical protein
MEEDEDRRARFYVPSWIIYNKTGKVHYVRCVQEPDF